MATDILYTIVYYFNYYLGPFEIFNSWLENQKTVRNYFTVFLLDGLFVMCNIMNSFSFLSQTFMFLFDFMLYSSLFVIVRTYIVSSLSSYNNSDNNAYSETSSEYTEEDKEFEDKQTPIETVNSQEMKTLENNEEVKIPENPVNSSYLKSFRFSFGNSKKPELENIEEDFHMM